MRFADPADAVEAKRRLDGLAGRVPSLRSLAAGLDVGRTEASYDLALTTTHDTPDDLAAYAADPVHQDVLAWLRPRLSGRVVVDYVT